MSRDFKGRSILVVGLGATGLSCVRYLKQCAASVAVTDTRLNPPGLETLKQEFPEVPIVLGRLFAEQMLALQEVVVSPGVSCQEPFIRECRKKGIPVVGDVELFAVARTAPVIAITGSNGKTTVTTLVGRMVQASGFRVAVCGNIGWPVLEALISRPDYFVVELSSFQLETTYSLRPKVSVVLNVSSNHMDRYSSLDHYLSAKQRIYQGCDLPVVNLDEAEIWKSLPGLKEGIGFTLQVPKKGQLGLREFNNALYLSFGEEPLLNTHELKLRGKHHFQNALASLAVGLSMGLPLETMRTVLKNFSGLPHRCEFIARRQGAVWYNDSKGTTVSSATAAITTLGPQTAGRLFLIAGGDAKSAELSGLRAPIAQWVSWVFLLGKDAEAIASVIHGAAPYEFVHSLEEAVLLAADRVKEGDCVLLSPACASWDMFRNYEHRGEVFSEAVRGLPE